MGMPVPVERWTRAEVQAIPDTRCRYELVGGELLVTPSPGLRHQVVVARPMLAIGPYVERHGIGLLLTSPADLHFADDQLLQPDLFVLPRGADPGERWERPVVPLLVIEVVSPSTVRYDREVKRRAYLQAGIPEYWVADPERRQVERWRPGRDEPEVLEERLRWEPAGAAAPLELDLRQLFAPIDRDGPPGDR